MGRAMRWRERPRCQAGDRDSAPTWLCSCVLPDTLGDTCERQAIAPENRRGEEAGSPAQATLLVGDGACITVGSLAPGSKLCPLLHCPLPKDTRRGAQVCAGAESVFSWTVDPSFENPGAHSFLSNELGCSGSGTVVPTERLGRPGLGVQAQSWRPSDLGGPAALQCPDLLWLCGPEPRTPES